jgi:translation initiation factor 5
MATYVNIPSDVKDEHYRYKMEKMILKIEGRGNGIKTVVPNMANVAEHLKVPPTYPTKYFGLELGAQSKWDTTNDRAIINGKFEYPEFEKLLNDFIKKFVCCYRCHLPECSMSIDKHENVKLECKACGHISTIPPQEKMLTFIIKYPPANTAKHVKANAKPAAIDQNTSAPSKFDDKEVDDWDTDVSEEAIRKRREEEGLSGRIKELTMDSDDEEDKKKKKKKVQEEEEEDESEVIPPTEVLKNFLNVKKDATPSQVLAAVKKIKEDYELSDKDAVCLMFESFFDKDIEKQIPLRAPVLKPFVKGSSAQKIILGYTEELCGVKEPKLLVKIPKILLLFYQNDLLEEEVVVEWQAKKKSRFVKDKGTILKIKEAAKPFVEWLKNAEEDDDDEEDGDE